MIKDNPVKGLLVFITGGKNDLLERGKESWCQGLMGQDSNSYSQSPFPYIT
jgi:hypothetical protein